MSKKPSTKTRTAEMSRKTTAETDDLGLPVADKQASDTQAADQLLDEGREIESVKDLSDAISDTTPTPLAPHADGKVALGVALPPTLLCKRTHPHAVLPQYQSVGAACFDLHALTDGHIAPGGAMTFETGLAFEVPEGFVMLVYSRSGHGFNHDVSLANCVGVIDSDYRGEVRVRLSNASGRTAFPVAVGSRIAQAMLVPVQQWCIQEVEELSATARGTDGFGSTGA